MTCGLNMTLTALAGSPNDPVPALVSLAEMYSQLRLDPAGSPPSHPDDALIELAVQAAVDELCGPNGEGWLGRALMRREYVLAFDRWPTGEVRLPLPPVQGVSGISYLDGAGVVQTLDPALYDVALTGTAPAILYPAYGKTWPVTRIAPGAVKVQFVAGVDDPEAVPALIRQWVKMRAGFYYENREEIITGTIATQLPSMFAVLENYRVRGLLL